MAAGGLLLAFIGSRKEDYFFFLGHIWWLDEKLFVSLIGRRDTCSLALVARRQPMGLAWRFLMLRPTPSCLLSVLALDLGASWPRSLAHQHAMLIASSEGVLMGLRATQCSSCTLHNSYLCYHNREQPIADTASTGVLQRPIGDG